MKQGGGKMVTAQVLKGFDLFKGLNDSDLTKITELCHVHTMHEGDQIFAEGTRAKDLHLCRSGKVNIVIWVREPWNKNVVVHRVEPGEIFGWSAVAAPYTYTASAECVESGEEIRISGYELLAVLDQYPVVGYTIMKNLNADISARLTQTRQRLSVEWLTAGWPTSSDTWGEAGRR
jgi:CRP-like cAMP-binding protein